MPFNNSKLVRYENLHKQVHNGTKYGTQLKVT